jgi:hypothetical protein
MAQNQRQQFNYSLFDPNQMGNRRKFTLSFWVRRNNQDEGARNGIITHDEGYGNIFWGLEFAGSSQLRLYSSVNSGGGEDIFVSDMKFRDYSNWYHIVVQADTDNFTTTCRHKFFVNGTQISGTEKGVSAGSDLIWNHSSYYTNIGAWTASNIEQLPLHGSLMDVFHIDGAVIDPSQFAYTLNGEWRPKGPETIKNYINDGIGFGTLGWYIPMHEGNSNISPVADASGNYGFESTKNKYYLNNSDTPNSSLKYALVFPEGESDRSRKIQTTNTMGSSNVIGSGDDFTIEFWCKMSGTAGTNSRILANRTNTGGGCLDIYIGTGSRRLYDFGNEINYGIDLRDGQWDHVALCRQNGTGRYYLNGVQQKSESNSFVYGHADYKIGIGGPPIDNNLGDNYACEGMRIAAFKIRKGTCSYPSGTTFTPPASFTNDSGTILLFNPTEPHIYEPQDGTAKGTNRGDWAYHGVTGSGKVKDNPQLKFARLSKSSKVTAGGVPNAADNDLSEGGYRTQVFSNSNIQFNGDIEVTSGKWYYEGIHTYGAASMSDGFGWQNNDDNGVNSTGGNGYGMVYRDTGGLFIGNPTDRADPAGGTFASWQNYGVDIIGVAIDLDSSPKSLKFYKNGVLQGDAGPSGLGYKMNNGSWQPIVMARSGPGGMHINFGQDSTFGGWFETAGDHSDSNGRGSFYFQPPTGYLALCDENLPASQNTSQCFGNVTWAANGVSGRQITLGFQPDMILDTRTNNASGARFVGDSQRGWTNYLYADNNPNDYETTESNHILATNSTGFTVGADSNINNGGYTYHAFGFKKCAAFDVVTYTGTGAGQQIPHSLGGVPDLVICKPRRSGVNSNWSTSGNIRNGYLAYGSNKILLQASSGIGADGNEVTGATSTYFVGGGSSATSQAGQEYVAYLFRTVPGLCKIGTYYMASNDVGTAPCFVHTDFKPSFVWIKRLDAVGEWCLIGDARNPDNACTNQLRTSITGAEDTGSEFLDIYSNGFAPRNTASDKNAAGGIFMYMAFAGDPDESNPTTSRAR